MSTLDIPHTQILCLYEKDDACWHHRVLLVKGTNGYWIWLTPDGEVQRASVVVHVSDGRPMVVRALRRNDPFFGDLVGEIYSFDPPTLAGRAGYVEEANALGTIFGYEIPPIVGVGHVKQYPPNSLKTLLSKIANENRNPKSNVACPNNLTNNRHVSQTVQRTY